MKDIVLVVSGQFSDKIVLESLGAEPQVEDDHAGGEEERHEAQTDQKSHRVASAFINTDLITRTTNVSAVKNRSRRSGGGNGRLAGAKAKAGRRDL